MAGLKELRRFVMEAMEMEAEELRIWREMFPRRAADVREAARAKVEGREPQFGPSRMYG